MQNLEEKEKLRNQLAEHERYLELAAEADTIEKKMNDKPELTLPYRGSIFGGIFYGLLWFSWWLIIPIAIFLIFGLPIFSAWTGAEVPANLWPNDPEETAMLYYNIYNIICIVSAIGFASPYIIRIIIGVKHSISAKIAYPMRKVQAEEQYSEDCELFKEKQDEWQKELNAVKVNQSKCFSKFIEYNALSKDMFTRAMATKILKYFDDNRIDTLKEGINLYLQEEREEKRHNELVSIEEERLLQAYRQAEAAEEAASYSQQQAKNSEKAAEAAKDLVAAKKHQTAVLENEIYKAKIYKD